MNYEEFQKIYSLDFLASIDIDIHDAMLDKFELEKDSKPEFTFFDVGSNAGSFIRCVDAKKIKAKIHAFEPHPYLSKYLTEKYPNVITNQKCLMDVDGKCKINIPSLSVGISSVIDRPVFNELKNSQEVISMDIESITIDTYCEINNIDVIDFLKLDVEGVEYHVFKGASNMLKKNKIICGQFEIGIEESGYTTQDIIDMLDRYGYSVDKCFSNDYFFKLRK